MTNQRRQAGYGARWIQSWVLPVAGGLALYLPTHSAVAAVIGTVLGFVLYAAVAARR
jgi:hypothetical protein